MSLKKERKVSKNYKSPCFALKLDVKKFFENVDHQILLDLIRKKIQDDDLLWLIENILKSFTKEKGIPIGNLTSQIFANIYLNELDQYIKHTLKLKYYLRYCDDFVILSQDRVYLEALIPQIELFLRKRLTLSLHEQKSIIRKYNQGIDFLGYIVLTHDVILPRTKTRRRLFAKLQQKVVGVKEGKITEESFYQSLQSYFGYLKHANAYEVTQKLKNQIWLWLDTKNHL